MWEPTDEVPSTGMAAYAEPDPSLAPLTTLAGGFRLHRIEDRGAWAKVAADNGWSGWVDGRLLVPITSPTAAPPPVAPSPAPPVDATPTNPPVSPVVDQTVHQPIPAVDVEPAAPAQPLGAPAAPLGGVPSGFAPPAAGPSTSSSAGVDPLAIGAAVLGVLLVVTYLLPWATFTGFSDHAFELAGDGRGARGDFGTRTDVGIILMQVIYGAIVLGPVAAVLFIARQPAASVVGVLAGIAGLAVALGRVLLDVPNDPDLGLGFWLSVLVCLALVTLSVVVGSRASRAAPARAGSW